MYSFSAEFIDQPVVVCLIHTRVSTPFPRDKSSFTQAGVNELSTKSCLCHASHEPS